MITPATAEWPLIRVNFTKNDISYRICIDYHELHVVIIRDTYPLPSMDECIDSPGDAVVFSTLDAQGGYWQMLVAVEDEEKTTFSAMLELTCFTKCPSGL